LEFLFLRTPSTGNMGPEDSCLYIPNGKADETHESELAVLPGRAYFESFVIRYREFPDFCLRNPFRA
jgi:hypothetical protein